MNNLTKDNFKNLSLNVVKWGYDKGIIKPENSFRQVQKMIEETGEIGKALFLEDKEGLIDAIGDTLVTIFINAEQNGVKLNLDSIIKKELTKERAFNSMCVDVSHICISKGAYTYIEAINSIFNFSYAYSLCPYECLNVAYNVISNRKTKTIDGRVLKV